jgi:hypothetical protein
MAQHCEKHEYNSTSVIRYRGKMEGKITENINRWVAKFTHPFVGSIMGPEHFAEQHGP